MGEIDRRLLLALAGVGAFLGIGGACRSAEAGAGHRFALTDVNVVDVRDGKISLHRTIVISGDRISAIQGTSEPLQHGVTVIPSGGKYVVPGLWDMHVHVNDERYLDWFVANGVTGVRDMGGGLNEPTDGCESLAPSVLLRWRSEVAAGRRVGPELVISGPPVSGTGWPSSLPARSRGEATAAVRELQRQRVDFIKVYEGIQLPVYKALASAAKRSGLTFAGHVPEHVGPLEAIQTGQRSIEHIRASLLVCFTSDPAELGRFFNEDGWSEEDKRWGRSAHASCPQIVAALQTNEVWLTPTLTVEKAKVSVEDPQHVQDERRHMMPQSIRDAYSTYVTRKLAQSSSDRSSERLWWRTQQRFVKRMNSEKVRLLAGTDTACEGGLPGYSLHGELGELVAAGVSPLGALRAATIEPALYFGKRDEGLVDVGYRANFLLLDANPLLNVANTRRIHAVVLAGQLFSRDTLNRLLEQRGPQR